MKWILIFVFGALLMACGDKKKDDEADAVRQQKLNNMYKTPPPSDRSKDKGF